MTKRDAVNRMKKVDLSEKRRSVSRRKQRKATKNDLWLIKGIFLRRKK